MITNHSGAPYAVDAPLLEEVSRLSYLDLGAIRDEFDGDWSRSSRAHLRYMAALWPSLPIQRLATIIHSIIGNRSLSVADVRLILQGRSLADAAKQVDVVHLAQIQAVGQVLLRGGTKTEAAYASGLSDDTVYAIDEFLGLTQRYRDGQIDAAVIAFREGWSVRKLADHLTVSKSTAHRLLIQARSILVELGEVK